MAYQGVFEGSGQSASRFYASETEDNQAEMDAPCLPFLLSCFTSLGSEQFDNVKRMEHHKKSTNKEQVYR